MDKVTELSKRQKNEERFLIDRALENVKFSNERNAFQYISFLDLAQQMKIELAFKLRKITNFEFQGGYEEAERKMLLIFPEQHLENISDIAYYKRKLYDKAMCVLRINLPKEQYNTYEHRTYLGALMKLGIERRTIGDILVSENGADILICRDIENYLFKNIKTLKRFQKSEIEMVPINELKIVKAAKEDFKINVSSLRLDCVVDELANCSRNSANKLIEQERVFINFKEELVPSKKIEENTFVTIRGKGRFKILEVCGTTRKGRLTVLVEK